MTNISPSERGDIAIGDIPPNDLFNLKTSSAMRHSYHLVGEENVRYFLSLIRSEWSRIEIRDNSLDSDVHEQEVLSYFRKKLVKEIGSNDKRDNAFRFVDLFCGAGGLSTGLEHSNFVPVLALDKDKSSLLTYHFNRPYLHSDQLLHDDIESVTKDFEFKRIPLVVGGPPCQGFSNANKQRQAEDNRNKLYTFFVHTVKMCAPDIFLLENVEGILKYSGQIQTDFNAIGYSLYSHVLNTRDFGFPQNRKRAFILGIRDEHERISLELNSMFRSEVESAKAMVRFKLWDAISDLPSLQAKSERNSTYLEGAKCGYTFGPFKSNTTSYANFINPVKDLYGPTLNHKSKFNNERDIEIYRLLKPGERSDAESIAGINPYRNREDIFKDKFFKLRPDEPSKTITAHMYYDCHMYIHPFEARGLTPREAARIQGFPDDYLFLGSPNEWYRQIGNAVSPVLGRVLGNGLDRVLRKIYEL